MSKMQKHKGATVRFEAGTNLLGAAFKCQNMGNKTQKKKTIKIT